MVTYFELCFIHKRRAKKNFVVSISRHLCWGWDALFLRVCFDGCCSQVSVEERRSWGFLLRHIDLEGLRWGMLLLRICVKAHSESAWSVLKYTEAEAACYQLGSCVWRPDWRINWSAEWADILIPGTSGFWRSSYCTNELSIQDSITAMDKPWGERISIRERKYWDKGGKESLIDRKRGIINSLLSQKQSPKHLHAHTEAI